MLKTRAAKAAIGKNAAPKLGTSLKHGSAEQHIVNKKDTKFIYIFITVLYIKQTVCDEQTLINQVQYV